MWKSVSGRCRERLERWCERDGDGVSSVDGCIDHYHFIELATIVTAFIQGQPCIPYCLTRHKGGEDIGSFFVYEDGGAVALCCAFGWGVV